ncbi:pentatricopeptide repeat-containing protein At3g61520, mitochondrial-like [Zingiber officinale]|uniref:Pentatricopeptide repeat-containing protein n=1 Tax=Zingiber officinale TaxID=94328 RepID=A0A8J5HBJ6_ZINOF|nr:pentatricopeptide repeat-containing protein At3g61520, mitochondrial-like [Zingiber officinale]KAG6523430.1 hypothetical protein ZIOFF_013287 [Zingiber officinale]
MKLVKNPCLRLTALRRCHAASSSTAAAATDFDCDGGVGTRSDVKHQKPSSNASPRHLKYQLYSLLGSASPGRLSAALSIVRGMLPPDSTSPPDAATRSIVFSGLAKRSQPLNEESLALLVEMAKMGLFPHDAILFSQFITKLCRCGATSGAWDFFHAVKDAGGSFEASVCNALLTGLAAIQDFTRMNLLFSEMKGLGVRPNVFTFGILINSLCKSRRIDDALNVLDAMSSPDSGVTPGTIIFNTVIDGLCKAGRLQDGLSLLDRMKSSHACDPDSVTYTSLIDAFCKAGDFSKVDKFLKEMVDEGCKPNVVTYGTLINGYCKSGDLEQAMKIFKSMDVSMVPANTVIYTTLIDSYCKNQKVDAAIYLFDEMQEKDILPNVRTYTAIFKGLKNHNMSDKAFELMDKMNLQGCKPDYVAMVLLTGWLTVIGETERLRLFVQRTTSSNIDSGNPDV